MKALLVSLLIVLAGPVLLCAQTKTAREQMGLLGPVKSIRIEKEAPADATASTVKRVPEQMSVFDETGNAVAQTVYNPNGSVKLKLGWGYVYDAKGREIKRFYYNDKGALTNTGVSIYDERGRRTQTTQINPNGSINHVQLFSYDDKDRKTRETHRNPNGTTRNDIRRSYNANGQVTEEQFYRGDGALDHRSVYTYDERGKQITWTVIKADGTSTPMFRKSQSYDERGNVKEAIYYRNDNSISSKETTTYEFDEHGNWIKRTTSIESSQDGRPLVETEITYRIITYF